MPAPLSNPRDLYLTQLSELLFIERTLSFEVMPSLLAAVRDPALAGAVAEHLQQTKQHVPRVEEAFRAAGAETASNHSMPFVGLTEQHEQLAGSANCRELADVVHAQAAIAVEHYEIACYRALLALAQEVAEEGVEALRENLAEEEAALAALEELLGLLAASAGKPGVVRT